MISAFLSGQECLLVFSLSCGAGHEKLQAFGADCSGSCIQMSRLCLLGSVGQEMWETALVPWDKFTMLGKVMNPFPGLHQDILLCHSEHICGPGLSAFEWCRGSWKESNLVNAIALENCLWKQGIKLYTGKHPEPLGHVLIGIQAKWERGSLESATVMKWWTDCCEVFWEFQ